MNMMSGTSVSMHMSLLHDSRVAYMQDPFLSFIMLRSVHIGRWSLRTVASWVAFGAQYHEFMTTGARDRTYIGSSFRGLGLLLPPSCYSGRTLSRED